MNDAVHDFRAAMLAAGLVPPDHITPGRIHRFPGAGKRPSNRAAWYLLFEDGRGGCYGDWSTGATGTWFRDRGRPSTQHLDAGRAQHRLADTAQLRAARRVREHASAARRAQFIWTNSPPAPRSHPYLRTKQVEPHGARLHAGCLMLPIVDPDGGLSSLQFVGPDRGKHQLKGGRKAGCCIPVRRADDGPAMQGWKAMRALRDGDIGDADGVLICEGWATACTLAERHPGAVVLAAIDAGNLLPVALEVRRRLPDARIVVAGDDDRRTPGNPGATKAHAAAAAAGALVVMPRWPNGTPETLSDFNDLAVWQAGGGA